MLTPCWQDVQDVLRRRPLALVLLITLPAFAWWLCPAGFLVALLTVGAARLSSGLTAGLAIAGALVTSALVLPWIPGGIPLAGSLVLGVLAALACPLPQRQSPVQQPVTTRRMVVAARWTSWLLVGAGCWLLRAQPNATMLVVLLAVALAYHATGDLRRTAATLVTAAGFTAYGGGDAASGSALGAAALALAAWHPGLAGWRGLGLQILTIAGLGLLATPLGSVTAIYTPLLAWVLWWLLPPSTAGWLNLPPSWRWFTWAKLRWDPVYRLLAADPRNWGRVRDAGCGHGLGALVTAARGDAARWDGLDLDRRKLAIAAHIVSGLPALPEGWHLHAERLPTAAPLVPADTILALDLLHYTDAAGQLAILDWLGSGLAPGGVLWLREGVLDDPTSQRVIAGERFTTAIGLNPRGSLTFHSTAEWEELFSRAGLTVRSRIAAGGANRLWQLQR
jgi:SAM-dependent methyltransferase